MQKNITINLKNFNNEFNLYFPDFTDNGIRKMIRNHFIVNVSNVLDEIQEEVIKI